MSSLEDVYEQWQNNAEFRALFKIDPDKALKSVKLELNAGDFAKINVLINRKNQDSDSDELDKRISK